MSSNQSFNLQYGDSLCVKTWMVGVLANGVGKKYKTKWYGYGLTCRRPQTYAESLVTLDVKKDAQDDVNV